MESTLVRVANMDDVEALAQLKRTVESRTYAQYGTPEEHARGLREFCSPSFVRGLIRQGHVVKAEQGGALVGMGAMGQRAARPDDSGRQWLQSVYCLWPGRGIGTAVADHLIESADPNLPVYAETYERNRRARDFLESLGFVEVGRRPSATYSRQALIILRRHDRRPAPAR